MDNRSCAAQIFVVCLRVHKGREDSMPNIARADGSLSHP
jgi:hypothetical protein